MLSGRGLGHTGGTLDKLDAIPGYRTAVPLDRLRRTVRDAGCAIVGQTGELAPADRRLYAIRDVTGTVESIPLITASILSKKLAAGPAHLVMDVKHGSGAFLPGIDDARALAGSIVAVATAAGLSCRALLTDMGMCLGSTAGNALEVGEAIDLLRGRIDGGRLHAVTLALAAELLDMAGIPDGRRRAGDALASGRAAERFSRMVALLGGPADLLERPHAHLPRAPVVRPLAATAAGFVTAIDARALGLAIIRLCGGRRRTEDVVDPAVGLADVLEVGAPVQPGTPLVRVHARDEPGADAVAAELRKAFRIGPDRPAPAPPVSGRVDPAQL
jgi:thymidine phosphorylase